MVQFSQISPILFVGTGLGTDQFGGHNALNGATIIYMMPFVTKTNIHLYFTGTSCQPKKMIEPNLIIDKQGHRGCRGLMPENTIASMLRAIDLEVNTLEMDAVISSDKKVVVSHESFFNHEISTKPDGKYVDKHEEQSLNIYKMNYDEIRKFDVGIKPHEKFPKQEKLPAVKPLLSDLIDSVENYCRTKNRSFPNYNIEIKSEPLTDGIFHPAPKEFTDLVVHIIREKGIDKRTNIQSFDFRPLQYLRQQYPSIKIAMLIEGDDKRSFDQQLTELGIIPEIYSPEYILVNADMVERCHDKKMKLIPWTVNDKKTIQTLISLGVDGVITDYPELFEKL